MLELQQAHQMPGAKVRVLRPFYHNRILQPFGSEPILPLYLAREVCAAKKAEPLNAFQGTAGPLSVNDVFGMAAPAPGLTVPPGAFASVQQPTPEPTPQPTNPQPQQPSNQPRREK